MIKKVVPPIVLGLIVFIVAFRFFQGKNSPYPITNVVKENKINFIRYVKVDSVPLYNDSLSFNFVSLGGSESDTFYAFRYPMLDLSLLSKKHGFLKEISRKGAGKTQFKGPFIKPQKAADNRLYVMEEGNTPRLTIYDSANKLVRSIELKNNIKYHYIPTLKSSFYIDVIDQAKDSIVLYTTIGSYVHSVFSKKLYEQDSSIAIIPIVDGVVKEIQYKVPLSSSLEIRTGLKDNKRNWEFPIPLMSFNDGFFYLKYPFDQKVYKYDRQFNLMDTYMITPQFSYSNYAVPFGYHPKGTTESIQNDFYLRYLNNSYFSMDVRDNKIYLLYYKPVSLSDIPKTFAEEEKKYIPVILHVYDIKTRENFSTELPSSISQYSSFNLVGNGIAYLMGNAKRKPDIYLYKYQFNYDK